MLNIIPENKRKEYNLDYLEDKYVNCKYLIGMKEITSETGLLVAISDNEDDYEELCNLLHNLRSLNDCWNYLICGSYNSYSINLQYFR